MAAKLLTLTLGVVGLTLYFYGFALVMRKAAAAEARRYTEVFPPRVSNHVGTVVLISAFFIPVFSAAIGVLVVAVVVGLIEAARHRQKMETHAFSAKMTGDLFRLACVMPIPLVMLFVSLRL